MATRKLSPYVSFAHPKRADEWSRIKAKLGSVVEHDMYLLETDAITHLPTAKAAWMCHRQYRAEAMPSGGIVRASWSEMPHPYKEHCEAVLLLYLPGRMVPANVCFRTTKCPAAKALSDALLEADAVAWKSRGRAYDESFEAAPHAFMRFFGTITVGDPRPSKTSGMLYRSATCEIEPTTAAEWRQLREFLEGPNAQAQLQEAAARFEARVAEVEAKVGK